MRHRLSPRETIAVLTSGTTTAPGSVSREAKPVLACDASEAEASAPPGGKAVEARAVRGGVGRAGGTGTAACSASGDAEAIIGAGTLNGTSARERTDPETGSTSSSRTRYSPARIPRSITKESRPSGSVPPGATKESLRSRRKVAPGPAEPDT